MTVLKVTHGIAALGVAALAGIASLSTTPTEAQIPTCSMTPAGPVEIVLGEAQGFMGGSPCAGHRYGHAQGRGSWLGDRLR